jgi:hypothetical protein
MARYWDILGFWREALQWLSAALAQEAHVPATPEQDRARAKAVYHGSEAASRLGDGASARRWAEESRGLCLAVGDHWGATYSLICLALSGLAGEPTGEVPAA